MFGNSAFTVKTLILLFLFVSTGALASTKIDTRIHDLITPAQTGDSVRVMSTADGRVYEVDSARTGLIATLIKLEFRVTVSEDKLKILLPCRSRHLSSCWTVLIGPFIPSKIS